MRLLRSYPLLAFILVLLSILGVSIAQQSIIQQPFVGLWYGDFSKGGLIMKSHLYRTTFS